MYAGLHWLRTSAFVSSFVACKVQIVGHVPLCRMMLVGEISQGKCSLYQLMPNFTLLVMAWLVNCYLVVSVAQLVARRTHDRKVVGSIPTNAVCFTVVR